MVLNQVDVTFLPTQKFYQTPFYFEIVHNLPIFDRQIRISYQISPHPKANCEMIQKQTVT